MMLVVCPSLTASAKLSSHGFFSFFFFYLIVPSNVKLHKNKINKCLMPTLRSHRVVGKKEKKKKNLPPRSAVVPNSTSSSPCTVLYLWPSLRNLKLGFGHMLVAPTEAKWLWNWNHTILGWVLAVISARPWRSFTRIQQPNKSCTHTMPKITRCIFIWQSPN
jgi:hypothetical protein